MFDFTALDALIRAVAFKTVAMFGLRVGKERFGIAPSKAEKVIGCFVETASEAFHEATCSEATWRSHSTIWAKSHPATSFKLMMASSKWTGLPMS